MSVSDGGGCTQARNGKDTDLVRFDSCAIVHVALGALDALALAVDHVSIVVAKTFPAGVKCY